MESLVGIGMRMDAGAGSVSPATVAVRKGTVLVDESNDCFMPVSTSTTAFDQRQLSPYGADPDCRWSASG